MTLAQQFRRSQLQDFTETGRKLQTVKSKYVEGTTAAMLRAALDFATFLATLQEGRKPQMLS